MQAYLIQILLSTFLCFMSLCVNANSLTPPNEPSNDSFYVCYKECIKDHTMMTLFLDYELHHYVGCMISRVPCFSYVLKQKKCYSTEKTMCCNVKNGTKPQERKKIIVRQCYKDHLKQFGWFNTYPKALNAFYRCAYS